MEIAYFVSMHIPVSSLSNGMWDSIDTLYFFKIVLSNIDLMYLASSNGMQTLWRVLKLKSNSEGMIEEWCSSSRDGYKTPRAGTGDSNLKGLRGVQW